jgi:hypothetical protein
MSMNPRHAAALALVGWYLMMPPALPDETPNPKAPLSQWDQVNEFDTAAACHKAFNDQNVLAEKALDQVKQQMDSLPSSIMQSKRPFSELEPELYQADRRASIFAVNAAVSQCIATDDPRLKGK